MRFANVLVLPGRTPREERNSGRSENILRSRDLRDVGPDGSNSPEHPRGDGGGCLEPEFVVAQLETLHEDVAIHGTKVGMVANAGLPPLWPMSSTETHGTLQSCSTP